MLQNINPFNLLISITTVPYKEEIARIILYFRIFLKLIHCSKFGWSGRKKVLSK